MQRIKEERGPNGDATPADRVTNALDPDARFGCKGTGTHRLIWNGHKVTLATRAQTDLILSLHVMPASQVDGNALQPTLDGLQPDCATLKAYRYAQVPEAPDMA